MIFDLFIVFAVLSCILIFLGYYTKPSIKILAVLGFATLFFLGLLLQFSGVTYHNGTLTNMTYSESNMTNISYSNVTLRAETLTNTYTTITDTTSIWIGRWLAIVSALSIALVFASNKQEED
jgi:hypothetical protein